MRKILITGEAQGEGKLKSNQTVEQESIRESR